jgi:hypothetical protein
MTRYLDTIEHPWERDSIERAICESFIDAKECIDATPGGNLWRELSYLQDSLWIFETSATDLLDEICIFGERSKNPSFWDVSNAIEAEKHTRSVKRYIFHCTSSLMALVDHARKFQEETPVNGYLDQRKINFSTPGLHEFLQGLRNYNVHWRITQAHWNVEINFRPYSRKTQFLFSRQELLEWSGWTANARGFINNSKDHIDVYELFSDYRTQAQRFYEWHKGEVFDQFAYRIRPYLEYKRIYEGIQKKITLNMLISHTPKPANPYQYIERYLPQHQIETLLALEHRSVAQVDTLIRMLGIEDFCDEDLRKKLIAFVQPAA